MSAEQDKNFFRTFVGLIIGLVLLTIALIILASTTGLVGSKDDARQELARERAEANLQGPAAVRVAGEALPETLQPKAEPAAVALTAEQINQQTCAACHGSGVLGAPKVGSKADWEPRLAQGFDTLVQHAITGIRAMPAKGGNPSLSDEDMRKTVAYMLEQSGLSAE